MSTLQRQSPQQTFRLRKINLPMIVSIPHTGTRFAEKLLGAAGHCHLHAERLFRTIYEYPIIVVPMRHPLSVAQSWHARGRDYFPTLVRNGYKRATLHWYFDKLEEVLNACDVLWLPVDHPKRDWYLDRISERTGTRYETDWAPVGNNDPSKRVTDPMPDIDLSGVWKHEYMQRLYGEAVVYGGSDDGEGLEEQMG